MDCSDKLSTACTNLQDYQDDLDNRSRRNNLIFFGIEDNQNETWAESESRILSFCSKQLQAPIASEATERAHRLGRYTEAKNRPLIVKFLSLKDKQRLLTVAARLKGSQFAISEDYLNKVRLQRPKLTQFARQRGENFKLNFNKLKMNGKLFMYDSETDAVTRFRQLATTDYSDPKQSVSLQGLSMYCSQLS